jgi:hypothetical protein
MYLQNIYVLKSSGMLITFSMAYCFCENDKYHPRGRVLYRDPKYQGKFNTQGVSFQNNSTAGFVEWLSAR